jgi:hypothetical protein
LLKIKNSDYIVNVIIIHSHASARSAEEIDKWVRTMDEVGIEKTIILSKEIGAKFDSIYQEYAQRILTK